MRQADDSVALRLHGCIAGSVSLEGGAVAVVTEAVEFDHETVAGPVGVDLVVEDRDVGERGGQVGEVLTAELGEAVLQRGAGVGGHPGSGEEPPDRSQCMAPIALLADSFHGWQPEKVKPVGLLPGPPQLPEVDDFGEVEQCSGDGRNRNAALFGRIVRVEPATMQADAVSAGIKLAPDQTRHIDRRPSLSREAPELGGASMAQQRPVAAGKDRGKPAPVRAHSTVTNRESLAVQPKQTPATQPPLQCRLPDSQLYQLAASHYSVLSRCQPRHCPPPLLPQACPSFRFHMDA